MSKSNSQPANMLSGIYEQFFNSAIQLRKEICLECNWSIPTFYRKARAVDKPDENKEGKIIPALSNAEKEGILRMSALVAKDIIEYLKEQGGNFQQ